MIRWSRVLVGGAAFVIGVLGAPLSAVAVASAAAPPVQKTQCVQAGRGDPITTLPAAQRRLDFEAAWPLSEGAGITVAVIDTGVTPHPALADRLVPGPDLIVPSEQSLHDCDGHGTLVAGIIAGAAVPGTQFAGVAPQARILAIRQFTDRYEDPDHPGESIGDVSTLASSINAAVASGVQVINISETGCVPSGTVNEGDDQLQAAIAGAEAANVVVVAAAGNIGPSCTVDNTPGQAPVTIPLPAVFDTVLAVAAVGPTDAVADFSLGGPWVDVAAPGTGIVTLDPGPGGTGLVNKFSSADTLTDINGTSFAAPYVTGVVALLRSAHPELTAAQVRERITATAQHPPTDSDRNDQVGYGMVNPVAAVSGLLPTAPASAVGTQESLPAAPIVPAPDTEPRRVALLISGAAVAVAVLVATFLVAGRRAYRLRAGATPPPATGRPAIDRRVEARR